MRKVHRQIPDLPQDVADRGTAVIERHLAVYGVSRARDLPEEGKVYLRHELQNFFAEQLPDGPRELPRDVYGWRRCWRAVRDFFAGR